MLIVMVELIDLWKLLIRSEAAEQNMSHQAFALFKNLTKGF